jgi:hypothetical protein
MSLRKGQGIVAMNHIFKIVGENFAVKKSRRFDSPVLSKPGLDMFLQAVPQGTPDKNLCRLGLFPPSRAAGGRALEFEADSIGIQVIAEVLQRMPDVCPAHMIKTVQKFGHNLLMVDWAREENDGHEPRQAGEKI